MRAHLWVTCWFCCHNRNTCGKMRNCAAQMTIGEQWYGKNEESSWELQKKVKKNYKKKIPKKTNGNVGSCQLELKQIFAGRQ